MISLLHRTVSASRAHSLSILFLIFGLIASTMSANIAAAANKSNISTPAFRLCDYSVRRKTVQVNGWDLGARTHSGKYTWTGDGLWSKPILINNHTRQRQANPLNDISYSEWNKKYPTRGDARALPTGSARIAGREYLLTSEVGYTYDPNKHHTRHFQKFLAPSRVYDVTEPNQPSRQQQMHLEQVDVTQLRDGRVLVVGDTAQRPFTRVAYVTKRPVTAANPLAWTDARNLRRVLSPTGSSVLDGETLTPNADRELQVYTMPDGQILLMEATELGIFTRLARTPEGLFTAVPIPIVLKDPTDAQKQYSNHAVFLTAAYGPQIETVRMVGSGNHRRFVVNFNLSQWNAGPKQNGNWIIGYTLTLPVNPDIISFCS